MGLNYKISTLSPEGDVTVGCRTWRWNGNENSSRCSLL